MKINFACTVILRRCFCIEVKAGGLFNYAAEYDPQVLA